MLPTLLPAGLPDLRQLLIARGFTEDFLGQDVPPATHYRLGNKAGAFYAEFLTPLTGPRTTRSGARRPTTGIAGLSAQLLRHLEILLVNPWTLQLSAPTFPLSTGQNIRIANPAAYLVQKLLIHANRPLSDRAKDILYIHDTLQLFAPRLEDLRREWLDHLLPSLQPAQARKVPQLASQLFANLSDPIRTASTIAPHPRPHTRIHPPSLPTRIETHPGTLIPESIARLPIARLPIARPKQNSDPLIEPSEVPPAENTQPNLRKICGDCKSTNKKTGPASPVPFD